MIDLRISEISSLISKSVSCKVQGSGAVLESRFGKLTLELSGFHFNTATLQFKRISGNGKILINDQEITVTSKNSFHKSIEKSDYVTISRPKDGIGEIAILGIILHMDEFEEVDLSSKWKQVLSRVEHRCLRASGEKLLAAQGAFISNETAISKIETNPPDSYIRSDGKIKFQIPCEITELSIDSSLPIMNKSHDLFIPRTAPVPIAVAKEQEKSIIGDRPGVPPHSKVRSEPMSNLVLYDSTVSREFNAAKFSAQNKTVKSIRSNNVDYLLLRKGGTYNIVTSMLRPNVEYIAVITAKKLNGNGRLQLEIPHGPPSNIIIDSDMIDYYVSVKSTSSTSGKLSISVPDNGFGEVLIARIQIIEGIQLYTFRNMQNNSDGAKVNQQSYEAARTLSSLNVQFGTAIDDVTLDEIARTTKKYARQRICFGAENANLSVNGTIMSLTFSGVSWLNKIGPMFPTLTIQRSKTHGDLTAFIGDKHNIQLANKIWLEPFDTLSDTQLDILRQTKMVLSPSLQNVNWLDDRLGSVMVVHTTKPIPFVPPQEVPYFKNLDYVVAFNRSQPTTKRLLDSWDASLPKLVLIGARGCYPDFVVPVNEYVDYHKLLYILLQSRCVVDLPNHPDYASAMLHFVIKAGMPVVTSNWFGMDKPNCDFILTNERLDDVKVPSIVNLREKITEAIERKRENSDLDNYNEHVNGFMSLMMG